MDCTNCGQSNAIGGQFCSRCGTPLTANNPTAGAPLLENDVGLNVGKLSFRRQAKALLFADRIDIYNKKAEKTQTINISQIENIKVYIATMSFKADGKYYVFDFTPTSRRTVASLFGAIGMLLSSIGDPGKEVAKAWRDQLNRLGVQL